MFFVFVFCTSKLFLHFADSPSGPSALSLLSGQAGKQTGKLAGIELPVLDIQA